MPNNLYDKIKSLEAEMNQIKKLMTTPKPEKTQEIPKQKPVFIENVLGKLRVVADTNSNISRNFGEQITLIETNGRHYVGINFDDGWFYVRCSTTVTNNII
jgi:hypothetical protein